MARFHLRTLGGLSLHPGSPEEPPVLGASKSLAVLAYLARAPGRSALRSHLSELLWPGLPRSRARRALRQSLYYLTTQAGTQLWEADDGRVSLADGKLEVDLWALDRALEEERWTEVAELYDGPFLAGFEGKAGTEFDHWAEAEHERVWAGVKAACHRLVEEALEGEGAGDPGRAVLYASRCVDLNPLDERAQEALVRAHLAAGDRVEAFRAYEAYRTLLRGELDDEPGPELARRTAEIRAALFGRHPEGKPRARVDAALPGRAAAVAVAPAAPRSRPQESEEARRAREVEEQARRSLESAGKGRRAVWMAAAGVAAGAAAVLALAATGLLPGFLRHRYARAGEPAAGADPAAVRLMVARTGNTARGDDGDTALAVRVAGAGMAAVSVVARPERTTIPSPVGDRLVLDLPGPDGPDIWVRDGSGRTRRVTSDPADEWPQDWSPDGTRILFRYGARLPGDRAFVTRLGVADVTTGAVERFPVTDPARSDSQAVWSPAGTAIAFAAGKGGDPDIYVADADGGHARDVSHAPGPDAHPAWSPDGSWLAFASRRSGSWDIYIVRPDGTGLDRLTYSPEDETSPVWISGHEVAYVADREGRRDLWAVDIASRGTRRLTRRGDLDRVLWVRWPAARGRVTSVDLEPRFESVSPGQVITFRARTLDPRGQPVAPGAARLRWASSDAAVLRVDGRGRAVVRGVGQAVLVASAGGWRADTLRVASRALAASPAPVLLAEDWRAGIDGARWIPCGDPLPVAVASRGPFGHALLPNGDQNYASGVLSRDSVPLADGVTLEWWASMPFNGRYFQALAAGLSTRAPRPEGRGPPQGDVVFFYATARPMKSAVTSASGADQMEDVPLPRNPGAWHRYDLELRTDGSVLYLTDGRLRWRSEPGFVAHLPRAARVVVRGNSLTARVLAGPVRVWRGVRYAPGGASPPRIAMTGRSPPPRGAQ